MSIPCPSCDGAMYVYNTKHRSGRTNRRYRCGSCDHRLTVIGDSSEHLSRRQRQDEMSCIRCVQWSGDGCSLGFPDPADVGPRFAAECAAWLEAA